MKNYLCRNAGLQPVRLWRGRAAKDSVITSGQLVWAGLDYSHARLIAPASSTSRTRFSPASLNRWNDLFLRERIRVIEKETKKSWIIDIDGVTAVNKNGGSKQIIGSPGADDTITSTHITPEQIHKIVKAYDLKNKKRPPPLCSSWTGW